MAVGILGLVARGTDGPAGPDERAHPVHERGGLGARDVKARDRGLLGRLFLLGELAGFQYDAAGSLIVTGAEGADGPGGVHGLDQGGVARRRAGGRGQARMTAAIARLVARHPGETIVAVSHADSIKAAVAHALGTPLDLFQRIMIAPASISAVAYRPEGLAVLTVNSMDGDLAALLAPR